MQIHTETNAIRNVNELGFQPFIQPPNACLKCRSLLKSVCTTRSSPVDKRENMCECWEHSSPDQGSVMNDAFGGKSIYI